MKGEATNLAHLRPSLPCRIDETEEKMIIMVQIHVSPTSFTCCISELILVIQGQPNARRERRINRMFCSSIFPQEKFDWPISRSSFLGGLGKR